jgi:hypothetical protein
MAATLLVLGCGRTPDPTPQAPACSTIEARAATPSQLTRDTTQHAICPRDWTCDDVTFFGSQATCIANCGGAHCFLDFNCRPGCLCP